MSLNSYDRTVSRLFGVTVPKGEVGIEIEVEGTRLPGIYRDPEMENVKADMRYHWRVENDGSLRAQNPGDMTAEYVLREPVARSDLDKVLNYFAKKWADSEATTYDSYRTSVHVHLNVSDWPMRKVFSFLTTYFILEELLTDFADGGTQSRVANRFCLRAKDAEFILSHLNEALKRDFRSRFDRRVLKYGAVNIAALSQYGSLEFRALRGTVDTKLIKTWVDMLLAVKDFSFKFDNPSDIISAFSEQGPERFLRMVVGGSADLLEPFGNVHNKLFDGMRLAQDIGFSTNWQPYVEIKDPEPKTKKTSPSTADFARYAILDEAIVAQAQNTAPVQRMTVPTGTITWGRPI